MNTLLVAAVGLIAGLLLAPRTGKENRELLKERFSSLRETLMRKESTNGEGSGGEGPETTGGADYLH
jgi:gas vesicle protein